MEENHKPNSHECLIQDLSSSWSELPLDLLISVFERLSFGNFRRAKSICSSWYTASKQSVPKNYIPLLILFSKEKTNSWTLFNLEEKDKLYKTQDLGLEFAKSVCVTTYGNWLLMQDHRYNLYIVNLFTHERINLPPVELQLGMTKIERIGYDCFIVSIDDLCAMSKGISIGCPVFWIDKKTKDYVVIWELRQDCVVYYKRGDNFWKQIPTTTDCADLAYKDHKLYFLSYSGSFKIFDFSGEVPRETFQCDVVVNQQPCVTTKLVFTATRDVLKVEKMFIPWFGALSFHVYKFYSSGFYKKPE